MKKLLYLLLILFAMTTVVACGDEEVPQEVPTDNQTPGNGEQTPENKPLLFESKTVVYDGNIQSLVVVNLPEGCTVSYMGNFQTNIGTYDVIAIIYGADGKIVNTLTATLTIVEKGFTVDDVTFNDKTFYNDGNAHSIEVNNLPEGYTVSYSGNGVAEVGKHKVVASVYDENNQLVLTLEAYINIVKQSDVELPLV